MGSERLMNCRLERIVLGKGLHRDRLGEFGVRGYGLASEFKVLLVNGFLNNSSWLGCLEFREFNLIFTISPPKSPPKNYLLSW